MKNVLSDIADMTPEERYQAEADLLREVAQDINKSPEPTDRLNMMTLTRHIERTEAAAQAAGILIADWAIEVKASIKAALAHPENMKTSGFAAMLAYTRPHEGRSRQSTLRNA
jgi:hypothetical protein